MVEKAVNILKSDQFTSLTKGHQFIIRHVALLVTKRVAKLKMKKGSKK